MSVHEKREIIIELNNRIQETISASSYFKHKQQSVSVDSILVSMALFSSENIKYFIIQSIAFNKLFDTGFEHMKIATESQ